MIVVYRILFLPVFLLVLPFYLKHMLKRGGYRAGMANRFGKMEAVPPRRKGVRRIWIQAVSVGELLAIERLLKQLRQNNSLEIILTTTTSTGFSLLKERFRELTAWQGVFPLDFWPCSTGAFQRLQPDLLVLTEGELWPEHLQQARRRRIPVCLINARLSDRSFRRHHRLRRLTRPLFQHLSAVLAGSEPDQHRFRSLQWIPEQRVQLSGNLKLDVPVGPTLTTSQRNQWLHQTGFADPANKSTPPLILLGSSTWRGEEIALLHAFHALSPEFPALRLLLVPRHAERRRQLERDLQSATHSVVFRSQNPVAPPGTRILVADTTGELRSLTELADIAFIGNSLPPHNGGQTPVEAAAVGKPILFGPNMSNFRQISRELLQANAATGLPNAAALQPAIRHLLQNPRLRQQQGEAAARLIAGSSGATDFTANALLRMVNLPDPPPA